MTVLDCEIEGGDYAAAGRASQALKERLNRIGADAAAVRRALIATYEAEANVVIHARRGRLRAYFGPGQLDVEVDDEGPGIPDLDLAMQEGYSTAPATARELGFGAGMGLPNIRRSSDSLAIQSTPGRGTHLAFSVRYHPAAGSTIHRHSVWVDQDTCRQCRHCLRACPTGAIRVRGGSPVLLEHRCIDCTACLATCATGALSLRGREAVPASRRGTTLVVPVPMLSQLGASVRGEAVLEALRCLGFDEVLTLRPWVEALRSAVAAHAARSSSPRPTISPICPSVVDLIALRFPSLLPDVAPFLTPIEAAHAALDSCAAAFVVLCPAQRTALTSTMGGSRVEVVTPAWLIRELVQVLRGKQERGDAAPVDIEVTPRALDQTTLKVTGLRGVNRTLEAVEKGLLGDVAILELLACDQGCYGSPLLIEEAHVARHRARAEDSPEPRTVAHARSVPLQARRGLRLDPDMHEAIRKLGRIDVLQRELPGRDCGDCGAPSCAALAEDVVTGRAEPSACPYRRHDEEGER